MTTNKKQEEPEKKKGWVRIPDGTKVRHRLDGDEGFIDGLTEILTGPQRNPDGRTQYRVNVGGDQRRDTGSVIIDCDDCAVRGPGCKDCVVSVLLGVPETLLVDERAALEVLADLGLAPRLRLVPIHRRGDSGVA